MWRGLSSEDLPPRGSVVVRLKGSASVGPAHKLNLGPAALTGDYCIADIALDGEKLVAIGWQGPCLGGPLHEENTVISTIIADVISCLG